MAKLFFKDKPLIGLDISQTGVKVMALDTRRTSVLGYGSLDLDPAKIQTSFDSDDASYLTKGISTLLHDKIIGNLPTTHVAIGVPTGRTFSRTFTLPAAQERDIEDAVAVEVDQYIPIPRDSLYVDHTVIDRSAEELTVIMSAVPRKLVDNCLSAATAAGLIPVLVEPGINAVARVLEATEEGTLTTLIIDIGTTTTDIAILDKSAIRISGGVAVGGNTLTMAIAESMKASLDEAHHLKISSGLSPGPRRNQIKSALDPHLQRIASEVRKVIRYYSERINRETKIEQVIIVGGGSDVPGIGEYFTDNLILPARMASPWQILDFKHLREPAKQFKPRYISVIGLAAADPRKALR